MFGALAIVRKTVQLIWYRSDCTLPLRSILVLRLAEKTLRLATVPSGGGYHAPIYRIHRFF